ncbi:MAG: hypothetical protein KBF83_09190 [Pyrinomonadaceae bacterium]|nr:hypothetical protein [Acidobacteriota bacterium]MBP9109715.1 hypothetical protein [Pyrinomonadaceae bacterium]
MIDPIRLFIRRSSLAVLMASFVVFGACSPAASKNAANAEIKTAANTALVDRVAETVKGATIDITAGGPADTVRAFYRHLREKRFRDALFLTNLRPAIESLNDNELKEFSLDFEAIAGQVPAEIEINGEIITGETATVTANLPNDDGDKKELQTIKLKKEGEFWIILTADEETAKTIKAEGKNYFFNLRIQTHEQEAKRMLDRIFKAQLAHSLQNGGLYADMPTLISGGLLPDDIKTSESTGYNFAIDLAGDKKKYSATATPAEYKKSGVQSFLIVLDAKGRPAISAKDNGGKALRP